MIRSKLIELIRKGENSGVEFKRDDVRPADLAAEMVSLLNFEGGHILLGIEDDGKPSGLTREIKKAEEWVMETARLHVQPAANPYFETFDGFNGETIGVITLHANSPDKPYKAKHGSVWVTKVRIGTTTRNATREEEQRLYQQSGGLRYGFKPVPGTDIAALDMRRLQDYFIRVLERDAPSASDSDQWRRLLLNMELAVNSYDHVLATVDGMILFGRNPGRFVPQSGIRAIRHVGTHPDYATIADEDIRGTDCATWFKSKWHTH